MKKKIDRTISERKLLYYVLTGEDILDLVKEKLGPETKVFITIGSQRATSMGLEDFKKVEIRIEENSNHIVNTEALQEELTNLIDNQDQESAQSEAAELLLQFIGDEKVKEIYHKI